MTSLNKVNSFLLFFVHTWPTLYCYDHNLYVCPYFIPAQTQTYIMSNIVNSHGINQNGNKCNSFIIGTSLQFLVFVVWHYSIFQFNIILHWSIFAKCMFCGNFLASPCNLCVAVIPHEKLNVILSNWIRGFGPRPTGFKWIITFLTVIQHFLHASERGTPFCFCYCSRF